ncbi:MAG TPA: ATP-grasp domain-containing protein [Gemmatimonadaceae bacterium]|nr:ATP-grasp domain-containing protein [Gemmatimonadaceae bacterium]
MKHHTILITDGEQRSALALVRALGRAGHTVHVCSARRRSLAGASRYCRSAHQVADALAEPARFVDDVTFLVRAHGVDVVIPVAEPAILALLPARARLEGASIPFTDADTFRRITDKALLLQAAPRMGIAIPEQRLLADAGARAALCVEQLAFPLVLKPSRSVGEHDGRRAKLGVQFAADAAQLQARLDAMDPAAYPLLLQQRIVGPGVGIFLLLWNGRVYATFSHRRIREKPPSGGVSVYRESIAADPDLVARSRQLLEHFGWSGVAMVEYKIDAATGTPYLMEINGRFWGSLQLAVDAGVDFPNLLLAAADGAAPPPTRPYRAGVRSRWWWGDVDHLLARLRRSDEELALPPDAPGRGQAVRDFLKLWRWSDHNEVLRMADPWPFVRETIEWLQRR